MTCSNEVKKQLYMLLFIAIDMQPIIIFVIILFGASILLQNDKQAFSQLYQNENESVNDTVNTLVTNSLNLSSPIYQAYSGIFIGTKNLSAGPPTVSED